MKNAKKMRMLFPQVREYVGDAVYAPDNSIHSPNGRSSAGLGGI